MHREIAFAPAIPMNWEFTLRLLPVEKAIPSHDSGTSGMAALSRYSARVVRWGEGEPLILLHGLAGGLDLVSPLAHSLAGQFQVIAYNSRAEDDPFALRRKFGLSHLVEDLDELIETLGLERPLVMGVSFGAAVALEFAIRRPHRLGGLVLQGCDIRLQPGIMRQVVRQVLARFPLPPDSAFINQFFALLFGTRFRDPLLAEFVVRKCWETDQAVMAHRFSMVEGLDFTGRLQGVQVPVLVFHGNKDIVASRDGVIRMVGEMQDARVAEIPGAGHLAFLTHADRMCQCIQQFVRDAELVAV